MLLQIISKMNEGGAAFTYPTLLVLFVAIYYFVLAIKTPEKADIYGQLIKGYGWAIIAWAGVGKAMGLIITFDTVKKIPIGELTLQQLGGGIKIIILAPLLAFFVFTICRVLVIILETKAIRK